MARPTPSLKRRPAKSEPKVRFIIYCEGKNTEPRYFESLKNHCNSALIEVEPVPAAGVPLTLASKAKEKAEELGLSNHKKKGLSYFEEADQIWAVFDRDEHPNFDEAVQLCKNNNIGVGQSDPCFEVWLILHFQDYDKPDGRKKVQQFCASLCKGYQANGSKTPDYTALIAQVEKAEARAKKQLQKRVDEGSPLGCPSTTVGDLTYAIREAAHKYRS